MGTASTYPKSTVQKVANISGCASSSSKSTSAVKSTTTSTKSTTTTKSTTSTAKSTTTSKQTTTSTPAKTTSSSTSTAKTGSVATSSAPKTTTAKTTTSTPTKSATTTASTTAAKTGTTVTAAPAKTTTSTTSKTTTPSAGTQATASTVSKTTTPTSTPAVQKSNTGSQATPVANATTPSSTPSVQTVSQTPVTSTGSQSYNTAVSQTKDTFNQLKNQINQVDLGGNLSVVNTGSGSTVQPSHVITNLNAQTSNLDLSRSTSSSAGSMSSISSSSVSASQGINLNNSVNGSTPVNNTQYFQGLNKTQSNNASVSNLSSGNKEYGDYKPVNGSLSAESQKVSANSSTGVNRNVSNNGSTVTPVGSNGEATTSSNKEHGSVNGSLASNQQPTVLSASKDKGANVNSTSSGTIPTASQGQPNSSQYETVAKKVNVYDEGIVSKEIKNGSTPYVYPTNTTVKVNDTQQTYINNEPKNGSPAYVSASTGEVLGVSRPLNQNAVASSGSVVTQNSQLFTNVKETMQKSGSVPYVYSYTSPQISQIPVTVAPQSVGVSDLGAVNNAHVIQNMQYDPIARKLHVSYADGTNTLVDNIPGYDGILAKDVQKITGVQPLNGGGYKVTLANGETKIMSESQFKAYDEVSRLKNPYVYNTESNEPSSTNSNKVIEPRNGSSTNGYINREVMDNRGFPKSTDYYDQNIKDNVISVQDTYRSNEPKSGSNANGYLDNITDDSYFTYRNSEPKNGSNSNGYINREVMDNRGFPKSTDYYDHNIKDNVISVRDTYRSNEPKSGSNANGYVDNVTDDSYFTYRNREPINGSSVINNSQYFTDTKVQQPEKEVFKLKEGDEGVLRKTDIDYSRISSSADKVQNENFIDESRISKDKWGDNGELTYKVRDDGSVVIYEDGVAMGYTDEKGLNNLIQRQNNQVKVNITPNNPNGSQSNIPVETPKVETPVKEPEVKRFELKEGDEGVLRQTDINYNRINRSADKVQQEQFMGREHVWDDQWGDDGKLTYKVRDDGTILIYEDGVAMGYTDEKGLNNLIQRRNSPINITPNNPNGSIASVSATGTDVLSATKQTVNSSEPHNGCTSNGYINQEPYKETNHIYNQNDVVNRGYPRSYNPLDGGVGKVQEVPINTSGDFVIKPTSGTNDILKSGIYIPVGDKSDKTIDYFSHLNYKGDDVLPDDAYIVHYHDGTQEMRKLTGSEKEALSRMSSFATGNLVKYNENGVQRIAHKERVYVDPSLLEQKVDEYNKTYRDYATNMGAADIREPMVVDKVVSNDLPVSVDNSPEASSNNLDSIKMGLDKNIERIQSTISNFGSVPYVSPTVNDINVQKNVTSDLFMKTVDTQKNLQQQQERYQKSASILDKKMSDMADISLISDFGA